MLSQPCPPQGLNLGLGVGKRDALITQPLEFNEITNAHKFVGGAGIRKFVKLERSKEKFERMKGEIYESKFEKYVSGEQVLFNQNVRKKEAQSSRGFGSITDSTIGKQ
ncbi:hypothetical protein TNCV_1596741 [Trichonephila clavipes]|nr:hypothetical protein TNCV_1596741 [Trichonephila clavipes]